MRPFAITRMGVMANGVQPMKLGLVSDIHGDPVALELAWAHLITMKVDRIVCAGDLVGYGPFPDRVVAFLKERQIPSVRGNHDRWAVSRGPGAVDELGRGKPSLETLEYLGSLPADFLIEAGSRIGVVVHGSPSSDMEFVNRRTRPPSSDVISTRLAAICSWSATRTSLCGIAVRRAGWWSTPARLFPCQWSTRREPSPWPTSPTWT